MTTHYIIMVIFHSYVKLPESKSSLNVGWIPSRNPRVWFYNILEEPRNQTQIILIWSPQTHILNSNLCESNSDSQITSSFQKWIYIYPNVNQSNKAVPRPWNCLSRCLWHRSQRMPLGHRPQATGWQVWTRKKGQNYWMGTDYMIWWVVWYMIIIT